MGVLLSRSQSGRPGTQKETKARGENTNPSVKPRTDSEPRTVLGSVGQMKSQGINNGGGRGDAGEEQKLTGEF